ncbi:hypothetical protein ACJX0J_016798, partial [Zea mays]
MYAIIAFFGVCMLLLRNIFLFFLLWHDFTGSSILMLKNMEKNQATWESRTSESEMVLDVAHMFGKLSCEKNVICFLLLVFYLFIDINPELRKPAQMGTDPEEI